MRLKWLCRFCLFGLLCLYTVYYWRLGGLEDRSAPLVRIGRENQARSRINPDDVFDPKKCLLRCVSGRQATACERVDVKIVGTKIFLDFFSLRHFYVSIYYNLHLFRVDPLFSLPSFQTLHDPLSQTWCTHDNTAQS